MPRPKGSVNDDFAATRAVLLAKLRKALLGDAPPASFRAMAACAGVAVPTLRHYFGDKEAALSAVFADCRLGAAGELALSARPTGAFGASVANLVAHLADGFRHGRLDRLHVVGLAEGFVAPDVARAYLAEILEPTIEAAAARLQAHVDRGEMRRVPARQAALALLSPVILLFLHQQGLDGGTSHPLDIDAFLATHIEGFVRGYAAAGGGEAPA